MNINCYSYVSPLIVLLVFVSCNVFEPKDYEEEKLGLFPEVYLTTGVDTTHTYLSLETLRQHDGALQVNVTGWGIMETGLFLHNEISGSKMYLRIMGFCGTVYTYTWVKETVEYVVNSTLEDSLDAIFYYNSFDTLKVFKE